jgi:hypothetical protein
MAISHLCYAFPDGKAHNCVFQVHGWTTIVIKLLDDRPALHNYTSLANICNRNSRWREHQD